MKKNDKRILREMAKRAIRVELNLIDWESAIDYVMEDNADIDRTDLRDELNKRIAIIENKLW